jgi:hypothetical protein
MSNALTVSPQTQLAMRRESMNLVRRARVGDQNARGMIMVAKRLAMKGNTRARMTVQMIEEYIRRNPGKEKCRMSFGCTPVVQNIINRLHSRMNGDAGSYVRAVIEEVPQIPDAHHAAVSLANNGDLLHDKKGHPARSRDGNPRIKGILNKLKTPQCHEAFMYGMQSCNRPLNKLQPQGEYSPDTHSALHIGRAVGIARKIQAVRLPNVSIATISPMAAWELGE